MSASADHHHKHEEPCGCGHEHHEHHEHEEPCSCGHEHHEHHEHEESCGCGHEHHEHHEHEEPCGCGHEHHEHHEHEESCCCGHEHHEHHEHEESCGCGHEHHEENTSDNGTEKCVFILENLGCAHCASKMEEKINALPGVSSAVITYATKQLRISAENPEELLPEIQKICSSIESQVKVTKRKAAPQTVRVQAADQKHQEASKKEHEDRTELFEICAGAVLFLIGLILHHNEVEGAGILVLFLIGYLLLGGKILLEAAKNISHGQIFDENFLMSIATLGAFAIGDYPEAMGVMLFYRIGELFEERAVEKSRGQIMDAIDMRPDVVNLVVDDEIQVIPAEQAKIGDLLLIRPGDRIPLDGVITEGSSRLDTSPITGEPVPVAVTAGDEIISGCVNTSGQLTLRVEKLLEESMVTRILDSVENAAASKPKIDRFITRFSRVYTPFVVLAALLTAVVPSLVTGDWNHWIYTALTFLVISCPCALVLSVPLAFFSGIGAGSRKGILFKGGLSIEALAGLKAVVMDKTGTITQGNFELQSIVSAGSFSEKELLRISAGCEQHSTHPIAHSIVTAAQEQGIALSKPSSLKEIAGHGIAAEFEGKEVLCGNQKLMDQYGISTAKLPAMTYGAEVFLAVNGSLAGCLVISDTIKPDAKSAIDHLKSLGLHTGMLTGDSEDSANAVASETGIDEVHARLLPQDKLAVLSEIRSKHGAVMFIGDGINDAPVLAGADVGAAMGNGADAAIEAADAVFMTSGVSSIPEAIVIARSTNRIAVQNVVFALIIKALVMVLGLLGFANMWMAVFADTGVAMLCVLNSIRILYKK